MRNPDRDRMFFLRQDDPMTEGKRVAFAGAEIPPQLKQSYAEVEDFLRLGKLDLLYCKVNEQKVEGDFKMLSADTTLTSFFHMEIIDKIMQNFTSLAARSVFGRVNASGQMSIQQIP